MSNPVRPLPGAPFALYYTEVETKQHLIPVALVNETVVNASPAKTPTTMLLGV